MHAGMSARVWTVRVRVTHPLVAPAAHLRCGERDGRLVRYPEHMRFAGLLLT